ncbi:MAG: HIT domain-containing protein [Candidatus Parvarchaeota archaeon]|nr:HIT domain-containing protein [Candidatus Parvarchaeota archaeon]
MECVFCDERTIKAEEFYSDRYYRAIYNLRPFLPGHSLVLPKRHIEDLTEMNDAERRDLVSFLNRAIFIALKYAGTEDYDLILQQGENAGRSISHLHFHILPRRADDSVNKGKSEWLSEFNRNEVFGRDLTAEEMKAAVEKAKGIADKYRSEIKILERSG